MNEITEAIGGLFTGEKGELFVVCLEMEHEPLKTNTTGSNSKPNVSYRNIRCGQHFSA